MDDLELMGFDDDDDDDLDLLGDDDDDDDDMMGLRIRRFRKRGGRRAFKRAFARRLVSRTPGAPSVGPKNWPLGFTTVAFLLGGATTLRATARPQRPFKGSRLVVDIARSGATATGQIIINSFSVGQINQLVSAQPVGAGTFAATAFGVSLAIDQSQPGIDLTIDYTTSLLPAGTDRIDVATTVIGAAVG